MEASLKELQRILTWLDEAGHEDTVLIGGWAVQAYNMWYGSVDIDLVATSDGRDALHQHLRSQGYGEGGLFEEEGFGLNHTAGRIVVETFNRAHNQPFESRKDHRLNFDVLDEPGQTVTGEIDGVAAKIPSREVLLAFKLKAAWDRNRRLQEDRSPDPSYEQDKLVKDRADVLALIDPDEGVKQIDLAWMSEFYEDHPFIVETTRKVYRTSDGPGLYEISQDEAERWVERLLDLAGVDGDR